MVISPEKWFRFAFTFDPPEPGLLNVLVAFLECCTNFGLLTKTRIEHEERHLVALLCTSDGNKTLVAVVLRLINLDDTSTELAYLVDLCTALSDDSADHVVGDEDLLS